MSLITPLSLVEKLLPIERDYFLWLNHHRSDFLDTFMYVYSDKVTWIPVTIVLLAILLYKIPWKEALVLIVCATVIGVFCDFIAAEFIKPFFARPRPTHHPDFKEFVNIVLDKRGGQFGFISNHAANGFGIAIFTSLLFRYRYFTVVIYSWVIVTAYSRVYLGVHFITDVLGGFIWGSIIGLLVYCLYQYIRKRFLHIPKEDLRTPILSIKRAKIVMLTILLTVVYVIVRGLFFQIG